MVRLGEYVSFEGEFEFEWSEVNSGHSIGGGSHLPAGDGSEGENAAAAAGHQVSILDEVSNSILKVLWII